MKYLTMFGLAWLWLCNAASADIILTAITNGPSAVAAGNNITLDLFIRSTVTGGQLIDGIDMNVNAATTANGTGNGTAGTFSAGTTFLLGSSAFDVSGNGPGQAFSTNFQLGGVTIADTNTLYGQLTLNTTGVADGNYFFNFDQLAANNPNTGAVAITGLGTTYSIVPAAVPEPSSLALLGLSTCGLAIWRRRRRKS